VAKELQNGVPAKTILACGTAVITTLAVVVKTEQPPAAATV
jgi:hypothetical protein